MDNPLMLLFISPFFLIPIAIGLVIAWSLWAVLGAVIQRIRGPKVIYTPKTDSPELIEAIRTGYTPRLGLELNEIFPDPVTGPDIDRILAVREKLFPRELSGLFYSVGSQDLSPTEFKGLALRLYLEMAFTRSYLLENPSGLWPQKIEDLWTYHTPKPLRKLNPDYYRQLLAQWKRNTQTARAPVAV
jgi:hypothetical protein